MAISAAQMMVEVAADLSKFNRGMASMQSTLKSTGTKMKATGRNMSMFLTLPAAAAGAAILKTAGDYESAMNRVQGLTGATGEDLKALEEQAKSLGETTQFSASEAADGMGFLAQAGFETNEILGAMPATLNLAAAAQMDLGQTADIVSNIMQGFGMEAQNTGHATDVLAQTASSANTDVQQLGEAMKFVAPVAAGAGISFEETAAAVGFLGDAGIQASMAGTSLRMALSRLLNPTGEVHDALEGLGLEIEDLQDAEGNLLPLNKMLRVLEDAGAETADVMQLFGTRAGPAMQTLLERGGAALEQFTGKVGNAGGRAKELADVQMQGLNGALKALRSALEGLAIAIAESGLLSWVTSTVEAFTSFTRRLAETSPLLLKIGTIVTTVVAALGPLLWITGQLAISISALIPVVTGLSLSFATLASATGIGAVLIALPLLIAYWDEVKAAMSSLMNWITRKFLGAMDALLGALEAVASVIPGVGEGISELRKRAQEDLRAMQRDTRTTASKAASDFGRVQEDATTTADVVGASMADVASGWMRGEQAMESGADTSEETSERTRESHEEISESARKLAEEVGEAYGEIENHYVQAGGAAARWARETAAAQERAHAKTAEGITGIRTELGNVTSDMLRLPKQAGEAYGEMSTVTQGFAGKLAGQINNIGRMFGGRGGGLANMVGSALSAAGPWGVALNQGLELAKKFGIDVAGLINKGIGALGSALKGVVSGIGRLFSKTRAEIRETARVMDEFDGSAQDATSGIREFLETQTDLSQTRIDTMLSRLFEMLERDVPTSQFREYLQNLDLSRGLILDIMDLLGVRNPFEDVGRKIREHTDFTSQRIQQVLSQLRSFRESGATVASIEDYLAKLFPPALVNDLIQLLNLDEEESGSSSGGGAGEGGESAGSGAGSSGGGGGVTSGGGNQHGLPESAEFAREALEDAWGYGVPNAIAEAAFIKGGATAMRDRVIMWAKALDPSKAQSILAKGSEGDGPGAAGAFRQALVFGQNEPTTEFPEEELQTAGSLPSFAKGVANFRGGAALVHEGELITGRAMLAQLAKGSNVTPAKGLRRGLGGRGGGEVRIPVVLEADGRRLAEVNARYLPGVLRQLGIKIGR